MVSRSPGRRRATPVALSLPPIGRAMIVKRCGLAPAGRMLAVPSTILSGKVYMIGGQPEPACGRVRFTVTPDIDRMLAGAPGTRAVLLEEGVPATAFRVAADAQLTIVHRGGRSYIRFTTAGNGDPVAVELPSGRVVELVPGVTRRRKLSSASRSTARLWASSARSGRRFMAVSRFTVAGTSSRCKPAARLTSCAKGCSPTSAG